jgi:hypothetical protein
MTINDLKNLGANVEEGVMRCAGNETFYLMLVPKALDVSRYDALEKALEEKDFKAAFEAAHALKGVLANLALTPILAPICEITELLRPMQEVHCEELLSKIKEEREKFVALL